MKIKYYYLFVGLWFFLCISVIAIPHNLYAAPYGSGNYGTGGYGDNTDSTPPVLTTITPVVTPSTNPTPTFVFSSTEGGSITYSGSCSSNNITAVVGNNSITFNTLAPGTYTDCSLTVTDASSNVSSVLAINSFEIQATTNPTSGGGGGGGGRHKKDIVITNVVLHSTSSIVIGTINKGSDVSLFGIISSSDSTPQCTDSGDSYIKSIFSGTYMKGDTFTQKIKDLQQNTQYHLVVCDIDNSLSKSSISDFKTLSSIDNYTKDISDSPQQNPTVSPLPIGFTFEHNISFKQSNINIPTEVRYLSEFLNTYEHETLPVDDVYGFDDVEAVKRFQLKYKKQILDIWNLKEATGYVGITTRLKINSIVKGAKVECPVFTEFNGGKNGIFRSPEVAETQKILQQLGLYNKEISGYWNPYTNDALVKFQELFHEVMLDPWNLKKGTGYKYKTTNKFLNYFAGCDTPPVVLEGVGQFDF